jgi:hypothetical protein
VFLGSTVPAWQSENERFTTVRTVTDGFSAAKAIVCLFFIEPMGPEHQALRHMIGSLLDE